MTIPQSHHAGSRAAATYPAGNDSSQRAGASAGNRGQNIPFGIGTDGQFFDRQRVQNGGS